MARAPDKSSAQQFKTRSYIQSWWANNPYYAGTAGFDYEYQPGNVFQTYGGTGTSGLSYSAARSGIVQVGGYTNISPRGYGGGGRAGLPGAGTPMTMFTRASPINSSNVPYDYLGNVKKQRGDIQLGLVLMGGYQFPGQAMAPKYSPMGGYEANTLVSFLNSRAGGGITYSMLRNRRSGIGERSTGWAGNLTTATSSNKAFTVLGAAGRGQSSEDSTVEMYSTLETRMGTRAEFTDEKWNEAKNKFAQTWAGYKALGDTGSSPFLNADLGQMFQKENSNTGFARRVQRGL